ncbi:MFS transporter [Micromonospora sp. NPDC047670]|uniref:MFS transporter n=1 Tax=Micromonospora sp. NPDC047670 TaxID=3364252 RepID=UPI003710CE2F
MNRLAILMFCVFSITTGEFVIAGILPEVAADLHVSAGTAGLLVTAYAIGMTIGGPVLTALTTHIDRKRLMLALLVVAVAGNAVSAIAPDFRVLLAARVVTALITSTFFAQAVVVVVRSAAPDRAATAVARLALGMNLAMVLGAPLGTVIGRTWGWQATFAAISAACLLGAALVAGFITAPPEPARSSAVAEFRVLGRRAVLLALAVTAVGNVGVLMVFSYLAPLLTDVAGHAAARLPVLLLGYGVGATIGGLLGGALFDRHPHTAQPILLGCLAAVLALAGAAATSPAPSAVAVVVIGALGFAIIPGMQTRVMSAARDAPTLAMAVNASGYQVAAGTAGLVGGTIVDSTAGPRAVYLAAAGLTLGGLALTWLTIRAARPATRQPAATGS